MPMSEPINLEERPEDAARRFARQLAELHRQLMSGDASDGFHTHNELYESRALLCALAWRGLAGTGVPVMRSWKHSDGQWCFGDDAEREWFIVVADLPGAGQVSYHYPAGEWELFRGIPEVETPIPFDGHGTADVHARLRRWLTGGAGDETE